MFVFLGLSLIFTSCAAITSVKNDLQVGTIATVESINYKDQITDPNTDGLFETPVINGLDVTIKPTSKAKPSIQYTVDLYESGRFRTTQQVSWTDDELKVFANKDVIYPTITFNETEGYIEAGKTLTDIYTIKVYATITPSTTTN